MRKQLFIMVALLLVLLAVTPNPARALEPVTDEEMSVVTGKAGISIAYNNFGVAVNISRFTWTDSDGEDYTNIEPLVDEALAATIRLENISLNKLTLNSIYVTGADDYPSRLSIDDAHSTVFRPLSIDVTTNLSSVFWGSAGAPGTGLCIGLPTLDAHIDSLRIDGIYVDRVYVREIGTWDKLLGVTQWPYSDYEKDYFKLEIVGADMVTLGGKVGFMANTGCGIGIGMDDVQIYTKIDEIRIEDTDGTWNPVNDEYNNVPYLIEHSDGPLPMEFILKDIEIDTMMINSLVFDEIPADDDTPVSVSSPGDVNIHFNYDADNIYSYMNNYRRSDMQFYINQGRRYNPLTIDVAADLPAATAYRQAAGGTGSVLGVQIGLPTSEIYMKEMSVGGMVFHNPGGTSFTGYDLDGNVLSNYTNVNQDMSLLGVKIQDSVTAIMSGRAEVYAR